MAEPIRFPLRGNRTRQEWSDLCEATEQQAEDIYLDAYWKVLGSAYRFSETAPVPDSICDEGVLHTIEDLLDQAYALLKDFRAEKGFQVTEMTNKTETIPLDIAAMNDEQLKGLEDYRTSPFGRSEFLSLVAARDRAQCAVESWTKIGYFISRRRTEILTEQLKAAKEKP